MHAIAALLHFSLTNLLRSVRVNKLVVDATGLGLLHVDGGNPVVFTCQPEVKVLLTELCSQETPKRLQSI